MSVLKCMARHRRALCCVCRRPAPRGRMCLPTRSAQGLRERFPARRKMTLEPRRPPTPQAGRATPLREVRRTRAGKHARRGRPLCRRPHGSQQLRPVRPRLLSAATASPARACRRFATTCTPRSPRLGRRKRQPLRRDDGHVREQLRGRRPSSRFAYRGPSDRPSRWSRRPGRTRSPSTPLLPIGYDRRQRRFTPQRTPRRRGARHLGTHPGHLFALDATNAYFTSSNDGAGTGVVLSSVPKAGRTAAARASLRQAPPFRGPGVAVNGGRVYWAPLCPDPIRAPRTDWAA